MRRVCELPPGANSGGAEVDDSDVLLLYHMRASINLDSYGDPSSRRRHYLGPRDIGQEPTAIARLARHDQRLQSTLNSGGVPGRLCQCPAVSHSQGGEQKQYSRESSYAGKSRRACSPAPRGPTAARFCHNLRRRGRRQCTRLYLNLNSRLSVRLNVQDSNRFTAGRNGTVRTDWPIGVQMAYLLENSCENCAAARDQLP